MIRHAAALVALVATANAQSSCPDLAVPRGIVDHLGTAVAASGAGLWLERSGVQLLEHVAGPFGPDEVIAIASGSKWLSAACVMTLVDDGLVGLDDPVSMYLPAFTGAKAGITLRQMFSHTSGLPGQSAAINDNGITLAEAVQRIAQLPLRTAPGTDFFYGAVSMHVGGRVAEVVTGKSWSQLFAERIATPLGMTRTDYFALGATLNPRIAGGVRSTLRDYAKFIRMLQGGGIAGATRILTETAIDEMFRDQTYGVPITSTPQPDDRRYGLGCWIDRKNASGGSLQLSSQGALGFSPWIDLERELGGVLAVQDLLSIVRPFHDGILQWTYEAIPYDGVECYGWSSPACARSILTATTAEPRAGNPAFGLQCTYGPGSAFGALLIGAAAWRSPLRFAGIDLFVDLGAPFVTVAAATDNNGNAAVAAPLAGVAPGNRVYTQFVWASGCGGGAFEASYGLDVSIR